MSELERDALFKKMRARPENKVRRGPDLVVLEQGLLLAGIDALAGPAAWP